MEICLEDFDKCCRCCLATVDTLKPIFGACLDDMLAKLVNLQVSENDEYPQQMCTRCVLKLSSAFTFYTMVQTSYRTLEDILKAAEKNGVSAGQKKQLNKSENIQEKEHVWDELDISDVGYLREEIPCGQNLNPQLKLPAKQDMPIARISNISELDSRKSLSDKEDDYNYNCPQCEYTSKNQEKLEVHLQTHLTGPKNSSKADINICGHLCNICGASFRWRTSLHKHLRQHRGGRYTCEVCQKSFAEASTLNVHMVCHSSNQKPFECSTCGRSFTQQSSLRKHAQTHDKREQLRCDSCDKNFLHKYSLQRHRENAHSPIECPICRKIFPGKKLLEAHTKIHNEEMEITHTELLADTVTDSINVQSVTVEFLCLICTQKFQSKESLEVHLCTRENIT